MAVPTPNASKTLTRRGVATRRRIIQIAGSLIVERGVAGTSLDEIMAVAKVSKSQLYHYFPDKDAIVAEVIQVQVEGLLAAQNPQLDEIDSLAALRRWRDIIVALSREQGTKGGCPIGSLANELSNRSEHARQLLTHSFERWRGEIEKGLEKMQLRGELSKAASPAELAMALQTAVQGGLLLAKTSRSVRPVEIALDMGLSYVEQHLTTIRKGRPSTARSQSDR